MVLLTLPVDDTKYLMMFSASFCSIKCSADSKRRLFVVMVPVLSIQTISTWLMDSTELNLCRRTPVLAILIAVSMYVIVIRRKRAMGTISRQMTKISSTSSIPALSNRLAPLITETMTEKNRRTNDIVISAVVMVVVSICKGVFLEVNFLALDSICDA